VLEELFHHQPGCDVLDVPEGRDNARGATLQKSPFESEIPLSSYLRSREGPASGQRDQLVGKIVRSDLVREEWLPQSVAWMLANTEMRPRRNT
jgi:hypothetical protein